MLISLAELTLLLNGGGTRGQAAHQTIPRFLVLGTEHKTTARTKSLSAVGSQRHMDLAGLSEVLHIRARQWKWVHNDPSKACALAVSLNFI